MPAPEEPVQPATWVSVERAEFIRTGVVPAAVPDEVAASWRRCCTLPGDRPADLLLPAWSTARGRRVEVDLAAERLAGLVASRSLTVEGPVLLLDVGGHVLSRWSTGPRRGPVGLDRTRCLAESSIGPSAVGLSMHAGAARQVTGPEHLLPALTTWTSSAAPVRDATWTPVAHLAAFEPVTSAALTPALLRSVVTLLELETRRAA